MILNRRSLGRRNSSSITWWRKQVKLRPRLESTRWDRRAFSTVATGKGFGQQGWWHPDHVDLRELGFCFRFSGSLSGVGRGRAGSWFKLEKRSGYGAVVRGQVGAWQLDSHAGGRIVSPLPKIWCSSNSCTSEYFRGRGWDWCGSECECELGIDQGFGLGNKVEKSGWCEIWGSSWIPSKRKQTRVWGTDVEIWGMGSRSTWLKKAAS